MEKYQTIPEMLLEIREELRVLRKELKELKVGFDESAREAPVHLVDPFEMPDSSEREKKV